MGIFSYLVNQLCCHQERRLSSEASLGGVRPGAAVNPTGQSPMQVGRLSGSWRPYAKANEGSSEVSPRDTPQESLMIY
jgi:hypothetical protein